MGRPGDSRSWFNPVSVRWRWRIGLSLGDGLHHGNQRIIVLFEWGDLPVVSGKPNKHSDSEAIRVCRAIHSLLSARNAAHESLEVLSSQLRGEGNPIHLGPWLDDVVSSWPPRRTDRRSEWPYELGSSAESGTGPCGEIVR